MDRGVKRAAGRGIAGALAAMLVLLSGSTFAGTPRAGVPEDGVLRFDIVRNGTRIGTQVYRFRREGRRVAVDIRTDIDYRLLFIPVYRFEHESHEVWEDGLLTSLVSTTNDNGEPIKLRVVREEDSLMVIGEDGTMYVDREIVPASLWNRMVLERDRVLGTIGGGVKRIEVDYIGEETLTVRGRSVKARHFRLSGEYNRELWYDENDVLVRVRFVAEDGSVVQYVPR